MSTALSVDVQECRFVIISGTVGDRDQMKTIRLKRTLLVDGTVRLDQHSCLELFNAGKTVSLPAIASVQIEPSTVVPVGVGRVSYIRESKSSISSLSIHGEVPVEMFDSLWQLM